MKNIKLIKIYFLFVLALILQINHINAQNLVPNPSFEEYSACPDNLSQIDRVVNWYVFSHFLNSPDYFNSCATSSGVLVPQNGFGIQNASNGNAYCGIYCYSYNYLPPPYYYREILYSQLIEPMLIGFRYYFSLKVSLADNYGCAIDKLGVLFTTYNDTTISVINNFAHIYTNSIIDDNSNWTSIFGSFVADSNYQYIFIGNFFHDTLTSTTQANDCYAYYYIDDVCVSEDSLTCNLPTEIMNNNINDKIQIFPNPAKQKLFIESDNVDNIKNIMIFDSHGYLVGVYNNFKNDYIDIQNYKSGLYLIVIYTDCQHFSQKIIIN